VSEFAIPCDDRIIHLLCITKYPTRFNHQSEYLMSETRFRRLRGIVRNAFVWGVAWAALTIPTVLVLKLVGIIHGTFSFLDVIGLAARFGFVGTIAGGAFSLLASVLYKGRKLSEISWIRFGVIAGVATAVFVPLWLQTMNLISGGGLVPWSLVLDDAPTTGLFGAIAAAGSMKLAQLADKWFPDKTPEIPYDATERLIARNLDEPFASAGTTEYSTVQRSSSTPV